MDIWTCGWNEYGQLGLGDSEDRNIPIQIPNFKAEKISARRNHTIMLGTRII